METDILFCNTLSYSAAARQLVNGYRVGLLQVRRAYPVFASHHGQSASSNTKLNGTLIFRSSWSSCFGGVEVDLVSRLGECRPKTVPPKKLAVCCTKRLVIFYTGGHGNQRHYSEGRLRQNAVQVGVGGYAGWTSPPLGYGSPQVRENAAVLTEGPSCIFVGPIECAEKARLEALYQQARDSYYSGQPLIVDDMFDKVETRLRWHGSKLVLKYPRCSLKRFSAYADAEVDPSQMWALASIWSIFLASGVVAAAGPPICALNDACQKFFHTRFEPNSSTSASEATLAMNGLLAIGIGLVIGIPVMVAAVRSLQGLWRGDLVALKGFCPNCGEEVYTFARADQSVQTQHKTDCHVCVHPLVFRANIERLSEGGSWAYGRVYLLTQPKDLAPNKLPDF